MIGWIKIVRDYRGEDMAKNGSLTIIIALFVAFSGIYDQAVQDEPQEVVTQCNDGIDNDADSMIDLDDGECQLNMYDPETQGIIFMNCPYWDNEMVAPMTVDECNGV